MTTIFFDKRVQYINGLEEFKSADGKISVFLPSLAILQEYPKYSAVRIDLGVARRIGLSIIIMDKYSFKKYYDDEAYNILSNVKYFYATNYEKECQNV